MVDKVKSIYLKLRQSDKVKSLGYNTKELKGIAAKIADNLNLSDEATDEEVEAEIDERIEATIPFLQFGQSQASRTLDEWRRKHSETKEGTETEAEADRETSSQKQHESNDQQDKAKDDVPAWAKTIMQSFEKISEQVSEIKANKTTENRLNKVKELVKNAGEFGRITEKNFNKMKFDNDEDFEDYLADLETSVQAYTQQEANERLDKMSKPPKNNQENENGDVKPMSDDELKEIFG
jgi:uncharacterized protein with von Willebrand factor type A (vWA) domain